MHAHRCIEDKGILYLLRIGRFAIYLLVLLSGAMHGPGHFDKLQNPICSLCHQHLVMQTYFMPTAFLEETFLISYVRPVHMDLPSVLSIEIHHE